MANMNKLRGIMAEKGLSQKALAAKVGISTSNLSQKMTGKASFNVDEAWKICDALEIVDPQTKCQIFLS
jgi:transcriptional regulator with XRE-family HTH domain